MATGFGSPYGRSVPSIVPQPRPQATWRGASGASYQAEIYLAGEPLPRCAGVYVWPALGRTLLTIGSLLAVYVGIAGDFLARMQRHQAESDKWPDAVRMGVTDLHFIPIAGEESHSRAVEADLIAAHDPPLNKAAPATGFLNPFFGSFGTT